MPGSLRIEKWPACKVYFSCVTTESSYYWKIKKKTPKTKTLLVKRTIYWVGVGKKWRKEEGISDQIESYEPVNLNKLLRCRDFITKNNKQRLRVWQSQKLWWHSFGQAFERERIYLFYHLLGTGNSAPWSKFLLVKPNNYTVHVSLGDCRKHSNKARKVIFFMYIIKK